MDPFTIGIAASLGGTAFKTGLGIAQMAKGLIMNPKRPTYQIPKEVGERLALRQQNLNARMAGAAQAERNISQSQANAQANASRITRSGTQLLAANAMSNAQAQKQMVGLAAQEAIDRQRRIAGLEGAQMTMAQYRDKAFDINQMQPFQDAARTRSALIEGGLRNIYGGATDLSRSMGNFYAMQQYMGNNGNYSVSPAIPSMGLPQNVQSSNQQGPPFLQVRPLAGQAPWASMYYQGNGVPPSDWFQTWGG